MYRYSALLPKNIATREDTGKVTAVAKGTATITVTTNDGNKTATCAVTVNEQITMTAAISGEVEIELAGTGTATIDWGDGSAPQTVTLSAYAGKFFGSHRYIHFFSGTTSRTIAIDGQNITHLACHYMELTALDVSKNTALTYLDCKQNLLTALDITKNNALKRLGCDNNQLTAEGLNALFGTLNDITGNKNIYIGQPRLRRLRPEHCQSQGLGGVCVLSTGRQAKKQFLPS